MDQRLARAVANGELDEVQRLVVSLGGPERAEGYLHFACLHGYGDFVEQLVERQIGLNTRDEEGRTPLHWAVCVEDSALVEMLINSNVDLTLLDDHQRTALMVACIRDSSEIVHQLAQATPDLSAASPGDGCTALHYASYLGKGDFVDILIAAGAQTDIPNIHGSLPLHLACRRGHTLVVQRLVDAGSPLQLRNGRGLSPIDEARAAGDDQAAAYIEAQLLDQFEWTVAAPAA